MDFIEDLSSALKNGNGQLSLEQVTDLLPNSQKHRVMTHLNAARNSGVCAYTAKVVDGKGHVIVTSPQPAVPTRTPVVGGTS